MAVLGLLNESYPSVFQYLYGNDNVSFTPYICLLMHSNALWNRMVSY